MYQLVRAFIAEFYYCAVCHNGSNYPRFQQPYYHLKTPISFREPPALIHSFGGFVDCVVDMWILSKSTQYPKVFPFFGIRNFFLSLALVTARILELFCDF